ncbi:hypothetical protein HanXRQr2_Chr16g0726701 [Helianthus annuus]|uniref:Uncharacterized protein n=1 Tax=Helianthus annuus TaxID=4232 RepID=A0A9K3DQ71_HELAN|nr:hypothetical protein HanXRQr2_Chr16g0726701 [Helianthus annuus]
MGFENLEKPTNYLKQKPVFEQRLSKKEQNTHFVCNGVCVESEVGLGLYLLCAWVGPTSEL